MRRLAITIAACIHKACWGAQSLSGRVLDSRSRGRGFEPHRRKCIVSLSPSLVLDQPRKTRPLITERLMMKRKESIKQPNKHKVWM